jgi:hypothetical protein
MFKALKKEISAKVSFLLFVFFVLCWVFINLRFKTNSFWHNLFSDTYGIVAAVGGLWGLRSAKKWGGFKSLMGKAISFFSLGLVFQAFGQFIYSIYYLYLKIETPYPSLGDLGYFGSIPFYIYAVLLLGKVSGVKISLKVLKNKIQAVLIPVLGLTISYFVFLHGYEFDWSAPLIVFLDFGYPLGQTVYISLAILTFLLSRKILGGIMKNRILIILAALVIQYIADFMFLYQFNRETWSAGKINDLTYLLAYFLMTQTLIQLKIVFDERTGKGN